MASQEWITDSNLGEYSEEGLVSKTIEYRPSSNTNRKTLEPILLSSNLPSSISLLLDDVNHTIIVSGTLPKIDEDTEYYFTYRLKEVETYNQSNVTDILDRYFILTSLNIPVTWNDLESFVYTNNNSIFEMNLKKYLDHANGNETFKKVSGVLPDGITFDDNGTLVGYIEENIEDITDYKFTVRVYSNGVPVENLEDKEFTIQVDPETVEQKPVWSTEPNIGNVNKNDYLDDDEHNLNSKKLDAYSLSGSEGIIRFQLAPADDPNNDSDITGLPPGLSLRNDGYIVGTCTTTQVKDWYFGAYALKIIEEDDNVVYSDYRKFLLSTNRGSTEHEINWIDPTKIYPLGAFVIGEEISLQLPLATAADGSIIKYSLSGTNYPKGIELSDSGLISGTLDLQDTGNYDFEVMAKTDFSYITRKFRINVKQGLSESALKLYLRINLEYKDEYTEIKNQLNKNTLYNDDVDTYNVSNFPKIDVATLKCYDREVLASMMNFGNPEIVRFGYTKSLPYSHIDSSGNLTASYEVFYKSIDENTYQWDPIEMGDYDFQAKLDQLKTTGEIVDKPGESTELEFNNETYKTSVRVWKLLGEAATYSKLISYTNDELKTGYFAKVLKDETHNDESSYYEYDANARSWTYIGNELPQDIDPVVKTNPDDSYQVFNFKNVRNILSQKIYVYHKEGTFYYDEGNQQIVTPTASIEAIKVLHRATADMYHEGEQLPYIKKGQYYITNEDGTDETIVKYESHIVTNPDTGHVYVNILFKPDFNSPNFMLYEDGGELYHVNEIVNPWCFDFSANVNISIDTIPAGAEMVMPNIKTSDVNMMLGGSPYVTFLDTSIEPLPMWKRKQAEIWKPNTVYKTKDIFIYDSIYYKVKQQFTSGNEFIFDNNLMEAISGDVIDTELPKNYFPTLDLGYYELGTNRRYQKDLNTAEKKGEFWYRKDFLFWELIAEPVYNQDVDTFGIPFYSTQNRLELINNTRKKTRTFEIVCDTPNVDVSITGTQPDGTPIPEVEHNGNKWKVTFNSGSYISWSVTCGDNYYPEGGNYVVVSDEKHVITLKKKCVITILPDPVDASVTLTAAGYTQEGNSIVVREGTKVIYNVDRDDYLSIENEIIAKNFNHNIEVKLKPYMKLTLEVTYTLPSEDTSLPDITLSGDNAIDISETTKKSESGSTWVVEKSIRVPQGTYVSYYVFKEGLKIKKGNYRVNIDNDILRLTLNDDSYTIIINPTPDDSIVYIEAEHPLDHIEGPVECRSRIVAGIQAYPTSWIKYTVEKEGYETIKGTIPYISSDTTIDITIKKYYSIIISVTKPEDANIQITNIIGAKVWEPEKYYDLHAVVKYNNKFYNSIENHTSSMEFEPSKWVEIKSSAWVVDGNTVEYEIKRIGYRDIKSSLIIKKNENIVISMESTGGFCPEWTDTDLFCLENNASVSFQSEASSDSNLQKYTFIVIPNPEDSIVKLNWNGQSYYQNILENVVDGDFIEYNVYKENYVEQCDQVLIANNLIKNIDLELQKRTLTIHPTPIDSNVTLTCDGYTQAGNAIVVHHGNTVYWDIQRKYWIGKSGSIVMEKNEDLFIELDEREKYTITVNITPSDNTTLTLTADGYDPVISNNGTATIVVDSETIINWTASHSGYDNKSGSIQALKSETINYSMTPGEHTYTIVPYPSDAIVTLTADGYTQAGNSITVYGEVPVTYSISRDGLATQSGTKIITSDVTDNITLHYPSGTEIFKAETNGTYPLYIEVPGTYYIQMVGGGGSGVNNYWWHASGGSGAYVYGNKYLNPGNYKIVVGGVGNLLNTTFETIDGEEKEIAGGGGRGYANLDGTRGGVAGQATTTLNYINGNPGEFQNGRNASGGASVYGGYGKGYGNATGNGTDGFVKITAV